MAYNMAKAARPDGPDAEFELGARGHSREYHPSRWTDTPGEHALSTTLAIAGEALPLGRPRDPRR